MQYTWTISTDILIDSGTILKQKSRIKIQW